jgi:hypothetical protein
LTLGELAVTEYMYTISDTLIPITLPLASVTPDYCDFKLVYTLAEVTTDALDLVSSKDDNEIEIFYDANLDPLDGMESKDYTFKWEVKIGTDTNEKKDSV